MIDNLGINYRVDFSPTTESEEEMARLLDLINAEWTSDPTSVACFDLRIIADVRASLQDFKIRQAKTERARKQYRVARS